MHFSRFVKDSMKVVVTGASGLLGRAVMAQYKISGHEGNAFFFYVMSLMSLT